MQHIYTHKDYVEMMSSQPKETTETDQNNSSSGSSTFGDQIGNVDHEE